jgi:hypothetical protein
LCSPQGALCLRVPGESSTHPLRDPGQKFNKDLWNGIE